MGEINRDVLFDVFRISRASRYSAPENGGDALPILYGDLTTIQGVNRGVYQLPKIDTMGAGTWCVAGHEIQGTVSLFDFDGLIAPGDYTLNLANDFQGQGTIATAAFSVAPNQFVEAICKGKKNAAGALIENPYFIAEDLWKNVWGFSDQTIDATALGQAAASADALGYKAAGVIMNDRSLADILSALVGGFLGGFDVASGILRFTFGGSEAGNVFPVKSLPFGEEVRVSRETSRDSIVNQVPVLYGKNFSPLDGRMKRHDDGESTKDVASQALYGARLPSAGRLDLDWVRDGAVAKSIQSRYIERFSAPAGVIVFEDGTFRGLDVEQDDYVVFSVPWLRTAELEPLTNQIGRVTGIAIDLAGQGITFTLRDTGFYLTKANLFDGAQTFGGGWLFGAERELEPVA